MSNPPYLQIDSVEDSCLAKQSWLPDASTHCNEPAKAADGLKYRKREECKSVVTHQVKAKDPLPAEPELRLEDQQATIIEQILRQAAAIMRSLDSEQAEVKSHERIDVKTPRVEDLERLVQRSSETEANLARLREVVRVSEERAAAEKRSLLEGERETNEACAEAKQTMDSSLADLSAQLRQYQGVAAMYKLATGLTVETQGSTKMRGSSTSSRPFTFELEMAGNDFCYRNLTKVSDHLDAFLKHEISSLHVSELPILFRRMLTTLRQPRN